VDSNYCPRDAPTRAFHIKLTGRASNAHGTLIEFQQVVVLALLLLHAHKSRQAPRHAFSIYSWSLIAHPAVCCDGSPTIEPSPPLAVSLLRCAATRMVGSETTTAGIRRCPSADENERTARSNRRFNFLLQSEAARLGFEPLGGWRSFVSTFPRSWFFPL